MSPEETAAILGHNFDSLQEEKRREEEQGGGGAVANFRSRPQATRRPRLDKHVAAPPPPTVQCSCTVAVALIESIYSILDRFRQINICF